MVIGRAYAEVLFIIPVAEYVSVRIVTEVFWTEFPNIAILYYLRVITELSIRASLNG